MALQQKGQRVRRLESLLAQREGETAGLQQRCATADAQLNAAAEQQAGHQQEVGALRQAVEQVTAANRSLQEQVRQLPALREKVQALEQQAAQLQAAEAAAADAERAAAEAAGRSAAQEAAHAAQLQRLQGERAAQLERAHQAGREAAGAEWQPVVRLWRAVGSGQFEPIATGVKTMAKAGDLAFPRLSLENE